MSNEFLHPSELDDDKLVYWGRHYNERYIDLQKKLNWVSEIYGDYLAELSNRNLIDKLLDD